MLSLTLCNIKHHYQLTCQEHAFITTSFQQAKYLIHVSADSQLTVCKDSCRVVDKISDQCNSQFTSIKENRSVKFFDYLYDFNCSVPKSYLIPDMPHDTEKCIQAEDLCELVYICIHIFCSLYVHIMCDYIIIFPSSWHCHWITWLLFNFWWV